MTELNNLSYSYSLNEWNGMFITGHLNHSGWTFMFFGFGVCSSGDKEDALMLFRVLPERKCVRLFCYGGLFSPSIGKSLLC